MIKSLVRKSLFLVLVAAPFLAFGSETVFTNLNCAVTFPPGWQRAPAPGDATNYYAIRKSPDEMRSVVVHVRRLGYRHAAIDEEFKREGARAFKEEGTLLSERDITISGQAAWELSGELPFQGRKVTTVSHLFFAGDNAYKINVLFAGGDARSDEQLQNCLNSFRLLEPPAPPQVAPLHPAPFPLAVLTISACVLVALFATKGMAYGPRGFLAAWGLWVGIRLFRAITSPVWTSSSDMNAKAASFGAVAIPALCLWLLWSLYQKPQRKVQVWLLIMCAIAFWKFFVASILVYMLPSPGGHTLGEAILQWWHRSTTGPLAAIDAFLPLFLLSGAVFWPAFCYSQRGAKAPVTEPLPNESRNQ